jgi:MFS family permease
MHLAVAAATAMVIVNTVVLVRDGLGRTNGDVAIALGAFGIGSMTIAILTPRLLRRVTDRRLMTLSAFALAAGLIALTAALATGGLSWTWLLLDWFVLGAATAAILTPTGRLVTASAAPNDRPAAFAAQFSLSHGWFLVTYPIAGWLASGTALSTASMLLAGVATAAAVVGLAVWPARDATAIAHVHAELDPADPHLADARRTGIGWGHEHDFVIDDLHRHWPRSELPCDADRRISAASGSRS